MATEAAVLTASEIAKTSILFAMTNRNHIEEEEEEEEEILMQMMLLQQDSEANSFKRIWKYPSSTLWWEQILPQLPEKIFVAHFRVDKQTFAYLVEELRDDLETQDTQMRKAVPLAKKIAVALKALATTSDFNTIAALFGIGRSSAHKYFKEFVDVVYKRLVPKHIIWPSSNSEFETLETDFENLWQFPGAIGAIDGSHIPFNPPVNLATDFHNYKGWNSILALAICDANGKILWAKAGLPGRLSDSGAFRNTEIFSKFQEGMLPDRNSEPFPFVLLGDAGFALEKWLMKPFTYRTSLTNEQKVFNYRLSRARRVIENCFGRLKQRFRRLLKGLDVHYGTAHAVVLTAMALHNICEDKRIPLRLFSSERAENDRLQSAYQQPQRAATREAADAKLLRLAYVEHFKNQVQPWE